MWSTLPTEVNANARAAVSTPVTVKSAALKLLILFSAAVFKGSL